MFSRRFAKNAARRWAACLLACFSLAAFQALPAAAETAIRPGFNLFSLDQDVEIGKASAARVEQQIPLVPDGDAVRYVERLGSRLAAQAPGAHYSYSFHVANLADINAFALPGGYVYVNRGLLEKVRSEGELAGVLSHEIAHVALRHATHRATKVYATQAGAGVLAQILGLNRQGGTSQIVNAIGGFGLNALFLKYSREDETQADVVGAQIMARAGYDPTNMADFFQLLRREQGQDPGKVAQFLSDHPAPVNREARVRQEARLLRRNRSARPIGSLAAMQQSLRRLPAARKMDTRVGVVAP